LNFSSFYQLKIHSTHFINCNLEEVDFVSAELKDASFEGCNLNGAVFENTLLENADLRTAANYMIDPEINRIRNAKFSMYGLPGLLFKYHIEIEN
jgi:uncharacterized protein YjbI with pentapeptide repeats